MGIIWEYSWEYVWQQYGIYEDISGNNMGMIMEIVCILILECGNHMTNVGYL